MVNLTKAKEDWNKIFSRAKAKGYLAPTPDSSQEKVTRKEQVKRVCPWYKLLGYQEVGHQLPGCERDLVHHP